MPYTKDAVPYLEGTTSKRAAEKQGLKVQSVREKVFECVRDHGGLTCDEVEATLGLLHQTAAARLRDLELAGRLVKSQTERKTRSDCNARVYRTPNALVLTPPNEAARIRTRKKKGA
jgi:predicted transcriptional regulator